MKTEMWLKFDFYFLLYNFFVYSFMGWIYESIYVSIRKKKWVNRGFLNGPIIPIYGVGATVIYVSLYPVKYNGFLVFLGGMILATFLEYITSLLMEKIFHAKWWDYSEIKFNIKGRICLRVSLFWGFLSVLMTELFQPFVNSIVHEIPRWKGERWKYIIIMIFVTDLTVTVIYTLQLDKKLSNMQKLRDEFYEYIETTKIYGMTEGMKARLNESQISEWKDAIKERMENIYNDELEVRFRTFFTKYQKNTDKKSFVLRRLLKAFPNLKPHNREYALKDFKVKFFEKRSEKDEDK